MCTFNNDIKRLSRLRTKGHVLKRGYKVLDYRNEIFKSRDLKANHSGVRSIICNEFIWKLGENRSGCSRMIPFPKHHNIYDSFHIYLTRKGLLQDANSTFLVDYPLNYAFRITPVYFFCDEVTGYENSMNRHIITVSRAFVKKFPKR